LYSAGWVFIGLKSLLINEFAFMTSVGQGLCLQVRLDPGRGGLSFAGPQPTFIVPKNIYDGGCEYEPKGSGAARRCKAANPGFCFQAGAPYSAAAGKPHRPLCASA